MANVKTAQLHKAWDRIREVGGTIRDFRGNNMTASVTGWPSFADHVNLLCYSNADAIQDIVDEILQIARDAEDLRGLNGGRFTVPVCTKPTVTVKAGCKVLVKWSAYNGDEDGCEER